VAIKKLFFIASGFIFLAFGVVGTVLPPVPITPFVLLATICFGKSSDRLHTWFLSTRFYCKNVELYYRNPERFMLDAFAFYCSYVTADPSLYDRKSKIHKY